MDYTTKGGIEAPLLKVIKNRLGKHLFSDISRNDHDLRKINSLDICFILELVQRDDSRD